MLSGSSKYSISLLERTGRHVGVGMKGTANKTGCNANKDREVGVKRAPLRWLLRSICPGDSSIGPARNSRPLPSALETRTGLQEPVRSLTSSPARQLSKRCLVYRHAARLTQASACSLFLKDWLEQQHSRHPKSAMKPRTRNHRKFAPTPSR